MILSPVRTASVFIKDINIFSHKTPRITQEFAQNPKIYAPFGLKGHNGRDYGVPVGTPLYAPFEGYVLEVGDQGDKGYGKFIRLRSFDNAKECVIAHCSAIYPKQRDKIFLADKIALSGNTGFSTGPHTHFGLRFLIDGKIKNYNNGFCGYIDPVPYLLNWL